MKRTIGYPLLFSLTKCIERRQMGNKKSSDLKVYLVAFMVFLILLCFFQVSYGETISSSELFDIYTHSYGDAKEFWNIDIIHKLQNHLSYVDWASDMNAELATLTLFQYEALEDEKLNELAEKLRRENSDLTDSVYYTYAIHSIANIFMDYKCILFVKTDHCKLFYYSYHEDPSYRGTVTWDKNDENWLKAYVPYQFEKCDQLITDIWGNDFAPPAYWKALETMTKGREHWQIELAKTLQLYGNDVMFWPVEDQSLFRLIKDNIPREPSEYDLYSFIPLNGEMDEDEMLRFIEMEMKEMNIGDYAVSKEYLRLFLFEGIVYDRVWLVNVHPLDRKNSFRSLLINAITREIIADISH